MVSALLVVATVGPFATTAVMRLFPERVLASAVTASAVVRQKILIVFYKFCRTPGRYFMAPFSGSPYGRRYDEEQIFFVTHIQRSEMCGGGDRFVYTMMIMFPACEGENQ